MAVNKVLQRGMDWMIGHEIAELDKKSLANTEKLIKRIVLTNIYRIEKWRN